MKTKYAWARLYYNPISKSAAVGRPKTSRAVQERGGDRKGCGKLTKALIGLR